MDKDNVVYAHDGTFFGHQEQQHYATFRRMIRTGNHHVKLDDLGTERQISPFVAISKYPPVCASVTRDERHERRKETEGQKGRRGITRGRRGMNAVKVQDVSERYYLKSNMVDNKYI